jgi:GNAT superfamily N-acetyltransferase
VGASSVAIFFVFPLMLPRNLLTLKYIRKSWIPYIDAHADCLSRDYYQVLKRFPKADPQSFRALFDKDGMMQAAASVDFDGKPTFLALLLTAPWRKKGSGSRLLLEIVRESQAVGAKGAIALNSAPTAISFYQKYGFTIVRPAERPEWDTPMRLSPSSAQRLLNSISHRHQSFDQTDQDGFDIGS